MKKKIKKLTIDQRIDRLQKTVDDLAGTMADGFYNVKLEFEQVYRKFSQMDDRFEKIDNKLIQHDKRFDSITEILERHSKMLIDLNQERVLSCPRFDRIETRVTKLEKSSKD